MSNSQTADIGLGQTILRRAAISPNQSAITFEGSTQTFAELGDRVRRMATVLRAGGISAGDRVGYIGLNHPVFLEMLYACGCLGAVFVPLNFRLTGPEVRFIANDAGISAMVADDMLRPLIDEERDNLECTRYITAEANADNWESLESLMAAAAPIEASEKVDADDVAFIMYTSGTTGLPKGAMLTHGNIFWNSINVCFGEDGVSGTTLTCAPLFHIGGLNVTTLMSLSKGVEVVLLRSFDAGQVLSLIEKHKVTTMFGAPTMFLMMVQDESFAITDLSSIATLTCGGAPVPVPLIKTYGERGINFCQGYGLTETNAIGAIISGSFYLARPNSTGRPTPPVTSVRIVDEAGSELPAGGIGEVCIKGPTVMHGYWNQPEATAQVIKDGWFHTGDIGMLDELGFLILLDRAKDIVIRGGENIGCAEVEYAIAEHPSVSEVSVYGIPDTRLGEVPCATVMLKKEATLNETEMRAFLRNRLAAFKVPARFYFQHDQLPRIATGKIAKKELRKQTIALLELA